MRLFNVLLFFLVSGFITGQRLPSTQFTDSNILPNATVRALHLSDDGALWIGTDNGLVRKLNNQVQSFFKEDGLPQNNVWALAQENAGRLWIGTYGKGLATYDGKSIKPFEYNNKLPNLEITQLQFYGKHLFVGSSNGIAVVDLSNNSVSKVTSIPNTKGLFRILDFIVYRQKIYAVSYQHGVYLLNFKDQNLSIVKVLDIPFLYASHITGDTLFLSGKEHYYEMPAKTLRESSSVKLLEPHGKSIIWDYMDVDGVTIAAAQGIYKNNGGVYELTERGMTFVNERYGIASDKINCLAYDPYLKILYVGTNDSGVYEVRLDKSIVFNTSSHEQTLDFVQIGESLATLFNDGMDIGDKKITSQQFKQWQVSFVKNHQSSLPKYSDFFYELDYNTPANQIIFYKVTAANNQFWVNTSIGIYIFDKNGILTQYLPIHAQEITFTQTGKLLEPNFYHGTRIYESLNPLLYTYYGEQEPQNPQNIVGSVLTGGRTYLTSIFHGLYVYENGTFRSYAKSAKWNEKRLRHLEDYDKNKLIVSNEDGDVFILNQDFENPAPLKIKRTNNYGSTITFLKSYKSWIIVGTAKGIALHNGGREIYLNDEQGIKGTIYNAAIIGTSLKVGSDYGTYEINLEALINQASSITEIKAATIKVNDRQFFETGTYITLPHDYNMLSMQLATDKHPFPGKLNYYYRLNKENPWTAMDGSLLTLLSLQPRDYSIDVKVMDYSTGTVFETHLINLIIKPPFYKTFWFVGLCVLALVGLTYLFFRYRKRQLLSQAREKEAITKRIEEVKMEALLSQMNPHFIFNSLNSVQYFISNNENDKAMHYLGTFSQLLRSNLNNSNKQHHTIAEEIAYLKQYIRLENARFSNRIKVSWLVEPQLSLSQISIPTMILQPIVENVFVHAFPPRIEHPVLSIAFSKANNEQYCCTITDNGIGSASFNKAKRHDSKAAQLIEERLSFLGYDPKTALKVAHHLDGTVVTLLLDIEQLS